MWAVLCKLKVEWPGDSYDILTRNCITFADEFNGALNVGHVPDWVQALPKQSRTTARMKNDEFSSRTYESHEFS